MQAENNFKDNADFSAAKHCRMELLLQKWCETSYFFISASFLLSTYKKICPPLPRPIRIAARV